MTLMPTYGKFEVRGIVVGLKSNRAFSDGEGANGDWNRLQFGVKVSRNSIIYVEMMGSKSKTIKLYKFNHSLSKIDKDDYVTVDWDKANDSQYSSYRCLQDIRINVDRSQDQAMHPFKATKYLYDSLIDGQQVLIKGYIQIEEYKGSTQEKFNIKEIYIDDSKAENELEAYFQHEIVFIGLEKVAANKYGVSTKLIKKTGIEDYEIIPYTMFINYTDSNSREVVEFFSNLTYGSTLKVHGKIRNYVPLTLTDDGHEVIAGYPVKELEITGGSVTSLKPGRYTAQQLESNIIYGSPFEEVNDNKSDEDVNKWGF